ncbi:glycosyltransferase family 2 protein [Alicyclobacillus sp. SO9]|uniref:glycosyltransferase family 2 protein n=1 Tax=Alicyclobacillus sp. SO9 TaxID=2665646 RepID=UPI0018E77C38|nr:glycosyltransferase family 2 protein [Alicyclobacillus sp. SO9]QQE79207.1 glycosyltransferase family 2 protein [Alicyclobacillus sp. SO9]
MSFSAVIVTYNSQEIIEDCLISLRDAMTVYTGQTEIIIVDNSSSDDVFNLLQQLQTAFTFLLIQSENKGFGNGVNLGTKHAHGDYIVVLNPDVRVTRSFFVDLESTISDSPRAAIIGPKLLNRDGSVQLSCRRFPSLLSVLGNRIPFATRMSIVDLHVNRYLMNDFEHDSAKTVPFILGACMVIRKAVFDEIGGFDQSYFLYYEDVQLCKDVWSAGWEIWYTPKVMAVHDHARSSIRIFSKAFWHHVRSSMIFYRKNPLVLFTLPSDVDSMKM